MKRLAVLGTVATFAIASIARCPKNRTRPAHDANGQWVEPEFLR